MVLLSKITEDAIVDNLKKRFMDDYIFVSFTKKHWDILFYTISKSIIHMLSEENTQRIVSEV